MYGSWIVAISNIQKQAHSNCSVDRLSHVTTVAILVVGGLFLSAKKLVGSAIQCWTPAHFGKGGWTAYANDYCWIKNTYKLNFTEPIPKEHEVEKRDMVIYYQWIPIILMVQALLFHMPNLFWKAMIARSGIDVTNILESSISLAESGASGKEDDRKKNTSVVVEQFHRAVGYRKRTSKPWKFDSKVSLLPLVRSACGHSPGNILSTSYLLTKLLYCANVVSQIFLLNYVLGFDFSHFGINVIRRLADGKDWDERVTPFPRVTMCDFNVRRVGNIHRYSMQCVLPINLFNERFYLFLWFWFVFLAVYTIYDLLRWLWRLMAVGPRVAYAIKHLQLAGKFKASDYKLADNDKLFEDFAVDYLRQDGVLILMLIANNTNAITVVWLVRRLFKRYLSLKGQPIEDKKRPVQNNFDEKKPLNTEKPPLELE